MNDLMSDKGVCRTAPATPGLLIIMPTANFFHILELTRSDICLGVV